jgi:hypothetical protein
MRHYVPPWYTMYNLDGAATFVNGLLGDPSYVSIPDTEASWSIESSHGAEPFSASESPGVVQARRHAGS